VGVGRDNSARKGERRRSFPNTVRTDGKELYIMRRGQLYKEQYHMLHGKGTEKKLYIRKTDRRRSWYYRKRGR
jgi:hypothetical protein